VHQSIVKTGEALLSISPAASQPPSGSIREKNAIGGTSKSLVVLAKDNGKN
jgi:hypothetical protein